MNRIKTICSPQDIRGLIYIIEYLKKNHFPMSTVLTSSHFQDIEMLIHRNHTLDIKESTIRRICTFRRKPTRLSYAKLDIFTQWCFANDGDYDNFKQFLSERRGEIINSNFITDQEVTTILEQINNKTIPTLVSDDVNIDLGNIPVSFNLGDGFVAKLIDQVSIVTGNLLIKKIKTNPKKFGIYPSRRIQDRLYLKELRRQSNIEKITAKAIEHAKGKKSKNETVDPDWIIEFFDIAQDTSDETMQTVWAKLLANEIDKPGSISRRTLASIKLINAKEAEIFTQLCNCIWTMEEARFGREKVLVKDMNKNEEYSDKSWGFNGSFVSHLEEVGLVFDSFIELDPKRTYKIAFFDKKHQLQSKSKDLQLEIIVLSQVGAEIFEIINPKPNEEYYRVTMNYFEDLKLLKK